MICQSCPHTIVGDTKIDSQMAELGYRTCKLARNEIERAMFFFKLTSKCRWPGRLGK